MLVRSSVMIIVSLIFVLCSSCKASKVNTNQEKQSSTQTQQTAAPSNEAKTSTPPPATTDPAKKSSNQIVAPTHPIKTESLSKPRPRNSSDSIVRPK